MPPQQPVDESLNVIPAQPAPRVPLLLRVLRAEVLRRLRVNMNDVPGEDEEMARERERRRPLLIRLFLGPHITRYLRNRRAAREQQAAEQQRRQGQVPASDAAGGAANTEGASTARPNERVSSNNGSH